MLEAHEVDNPHRHDEADGAKHTDGRESLHGVESRTVERRVGHRVGQAQSGHEERYAECVEGEDLTERHVIAMRHAHISGQCHEGTCQQMADTEHFLSRHKAVGHDTYERRHEERHKALHGVEPADILGQAHLGKVTAHRGEVGTPHGELKEVHHNQSYFCIHA